MDRKLLRRILVNLLSNALKYSPNGNEVNFTLICETDQAIFQIQDRGIGIPPEDLEYLFDKFFRAKNVGSIDGTGLGLAIVKQCTEVHQGKIEVQSQIAQGTTFVVTLPIVPNRVA
jgi:signal transduction histidine kinase